MSARNRFFILLGIIFVIAVIYYAFSLTIPKTWCSSARSIRIR